MTFGRDRGTAASGGALLRRKCACGGEAGSGGECGACRRKREGAVQRFPRPAPTAPIHADAPAIVYEALRAGGRPLAAADRGYFESRMGHDFGGVRVHTGTLAAQSADAVSAHAYTVGQDIVFAAGRYAPGTSAGRKLLAHELAHVRQDGPRPAARPARGLTVADPAGAAERDADRLANRVAEGPAGARDHPAAGLSESMGRAVIRRTPAAPTYGGVTGVRDLSRLTIDPVPDFTGGNLAMMKVVNPHVNDPNVKHLSWELYDPKDQLMQGSFSMLPGTPAATTAPFVLAGNMFTGAGFVPGKYLLRCVGRNASHQPIVYADRDFTVVSSDLATNIPLLTTSGFLTFTQYDKTDANPPATPNYSINVALSFLPLATVTCDDVAFMQSMQTIDAQGRSQQNTVNAEQDARQTPLAWAIDRVAGAPSPFYIAGRDATGATADQPGWGQAGKGGTSPSVATLLDKPSWNQSNNAKFESCAVCRSGANRGQVYGCATWGYTATADGKVTLMPRSFRQMPSDQFEEARAAWNAWRTTRPAADRPEEAPALRSP